jgi:predicted transcriptional regulator
MGDDRLLYELVRHRKESGLTQAEVDERLGWEPGQTAEFEAYWSDPRMSDIRRYALAIGMGIRHETFVEMD